MKTTLPFGPWLPDSPDFASGGVLVAKNVIPRKASYSPFFGLRPFSDALPSVCVGAAAFKQTNGAIHNFSGTSTDLYSLSAAAWSEATRTSGGDYSVPNGGRWVFLGFGDNVIASNGADAPQRFILGTDTNFSDLAGSPPAFRYGAVIGQFAVVGNIGSANPNRFQWCDQNDITDWSNGQAGSLDIPKGGDVQGITGGEYGLVFQERQISRIDYVGPPSVWQRNVIEENRGALAAGSIARHGVRTFFLADDGFYVCDGTQAIPIGDETVDRTVLDDIDGNHRERIIAAIDPINKLYVMAYPGVSNTGGRPNRMAVCNYETGYKWSCVELEVDFIYAALSDYITLESLSTLYGNLESVPFSLDSRAWQGNSLILSAFGTDLKGSHFSGEPLEAVITTGEQRLNSEGRAEITNTRPIVDAPATLRIGSRGRQNDAVTFTASASMNEFGENPIINNDRFQRIELTIPAGETWTHAQGVEVTYTNAGEY